MREKKIVRARTAEDLYKERIVHNSKGGMELREYQRKIVKDADQKNALIVLPTGTGSIALPLPLSGSRETER